MEQILLHSSNPYSKCEIIPKHLISLYKQFQFMARIWILWRKSVDISCSCNSFGIQKTAGGTFPVPIAQCSKKFPYAVHLS